MKVSSQSYVKYIYKITVTNIFIVCIVLKKIKSRYFYFWKSTCLKIKNIANSSVKN
jgi:hypothetical protein